MTRIEKLVGLAAASALFIYALSCRPAWSPDSSTVAFPFHLYKTSGVALYNVNTGQLETAVSYPARMDQALLQTLWHKDKILVLCHGDKPSPDGDKKEVALLEFDPRTHAIQGIRNLDFGQGAVSPMIPPVKDQEGNLWLGGVETKGLCLFKVSPDGETVKGVGPERVLTLDSGGGRIFYVTHPKEKNIPIEFGVFHPDREELQTLTTLERLSIEEVFPYITAAPDGSSACVAVTWKDRTSALLFVNHDGGAIQRIALPWEIDEAGGLAFSGNSTTVWFACIPKRERSEEKRPGLFEIHPEKGVVREVILPVKREKMKKSNTIMLHPAVSPDGKWLALSTYIFEEESPSRLFLVDLQAEELKVKIINPPGISK